MSTKACSTIYVCDSITLLTNVMLYWATETIKTSFLPYYDVTQAGAERFINVQRWTEMTSGGHFAALEDPESLVRDIREFFRPFRNKSAQ